HPSSASIPLAPGKGRAQLLCFLLNGRRPGAAYNSCSAILLGDDFRFRSTAPSLQPKGQLSAAGHSKSVLVLVYECRRGIEFNPFIHYPMRNVKRQNGPWRGQTGDCL